MSEQASSPSTQRGQRMYMNSRKSRHVPEPCHMLDAVGVCAAIRMATTVRASKQAQPLYRSQPVLR